MESLRSIFTKNACPGEERGRNPEDIFFLDSWLRGTGKKGQRQGDCFCPRAGFNAPFGKKDADNYLDYLS
jgi:hypothetical protein